MSDFIDVIERNEQIELLKRYGFENIVDTFLLNENKVYTKKGRLNKSGACRQLNIKPKQLEEILQDMRRILEEEED